MTVKVIKPTQVKAKPTFKRGELVISTAGNQNIYFVTGEGENFSEFAGVRVSGSGEFAQYNACYMKSSVELFEGELVISND